MSYEGYDSDGDVGRFLQSPDRQSYMLDLPESETTHPSGGQIHPAPAVEAHPALQMLDQAPVMHGFQGPSIDARQHQMPAMLGFQAPAFDAGQHQEPAAFGFQATTVGVEHYPALTVGFQAPSMDVEHHPTPAMGFQEQILGVEHQPAPAMGFQGQILGVEHQPAPAMGFQGQILGVENYSAPAMGFQGQILGVEGYPAPAFGFNIEHRQAVGFQASAVEVEHHQAPVFGFQHAPDKDMERDQASGFRFHSSTNDVEHGQTSSFVFQAPAMDAAHHQAPVMEVEHNQTPAMDVEHHQVLEGMDDVEHHQALEDLDDDFEHHQGLEDMDDFEHHQALQDVDDFEHHQALEDINDIEQHQALEDVDDAEDHQAMATDVQPPQTLAPEEAYGVPDPTLDQGAGVDNSSWVDEMLAEEVRVIFPPPSPPRVEEAPVEDEADFVYVPFVEGQLDCTRCHSVRQVTHKTGRRELRFIVHGVDQGAVLHHAIIHHMNLDANGQFQTNELLYVDFRNHSHGSVQNFIESKVEDLRKVCSGWLQDKSSNSAAPPADDPHVKFEIRMLGNILTSSSDENVGEGWASEFSSEPVTNEEQNSYSPEASSQYSSLPVAHQAEENIIAESKPKPAWLGFTPDILESSQVKPYDPESGTSVLLYPSMLEKIHERQQARDSNLTVEDVSKMFEEAKEEIAREPDLSSMIFKRLSRKDGAYRINLRRIKELNRKIKDLVEQPVQSISTRGLVSIRKKLLEYKQEKADLFAIIEMGLQETEKNNDDNAAGPSGSH